MMEEYKMERELPFQINQTKPFIDQLSDWIGDVFYDILPEKKFELRDEQVFMAFQLAKSYKNQSVIFSEAGVGTGKTIVYLLYAIMYARYTGKPAIIACANESLIEQLVKEDGDIRKLEQALDIKIDARLAKSPEQYLCLQKFKQVQDLEEIEEEVDHVFEHIPNFIFDYQTMQTFKPYGDRKEFPLINDDTWKLMNADVFYDCKTCVDRHRCGQTLTRDYYRKATDLIICSQDFYMMHIWTKEARTREGQLAFLPAASSVVFDEGHLLEVASQKALTYSLNEAMIQKPLLSVLTNDIREPLAQAIEEALQIAPTFFQQLFKESEVVKGSNRCKIIQSQNLMKKGKQLIYLLEKVDEELVFESEMHTIDSYVLNVVMEYLDAIEFSLKLFVEKEGTISWTLKNEQTCTLVVMPQMVNDVLQERVFSKKMPYVFSSATMSENGSFDYMASSLGISHYDSFTVDSPFDYEAQMKVAIPVVSNEQDVFNEIKKALEKTNHHALLLVNSKEELEKIKIFFKSENIHCLFEGDKEISQLIDEFEKDKAINLCSYSLWEGLDVPGDALQHVIICSLPFPPNDPVFQAKRKRATTPFIQVDIPYMHLRMRQGIGRLIRSERDSGWITILDSRLQDHQMYQQIIQLIPEKVTIQK